YLQVLVCEHDVRVADTYLRVADAPIGAGHAHHFRRAERLLVELYGARRALDVEVRRHRAIAFGDRSHSISHGHTLLCSSGLKVEPYFVAHARAPYCKNLTSVADGHVVQMLRALREIGRRI